MSSTNSLWDEKESQTVIARYESRLEQFGHSQETLGWGKKGRQELRFQILASHWSLKGKTVLDLGAGFGDFYNFAKPLGISSYTGIEISPGLVARGVDAFGCNSSFELRLGSVTEEELYDPCDVVVISGLFNFRLCNNRNTEFITKVLHTAFKFSRLGVACNFVTDNVDFRDPNVHYQSPTGALEIAFQLSRNVVLRQDYMPFEFTLFIDRRDDFAVETAVFSHL